MIGGWIAFGVVAIAVGLLLRSTMKTCSACYGRTETKVERTLAWRSDVAGIVGSDPYWLYEKRRVCKDCGAEEVLKSWTAEIPTDETQANNFREEVMAMDFTTRRP